MTQAEMLTMASDRLRDASNTYFTAVKVRTELNTAAQQVARENSRYQRLNFSTITETFTTTADDQTYALSSTSIRRIHLMKRTDTTPDQKCEEIKDLEQFDGGSNFVDNKWRFFVTRSPTTGVWTINFPHPSVPAGMVFSVEGIARVTELATDGSAASSSYPAIDIDYHELVVQQAVFNLLGPDSSLYEPAREKLQDLRSQRDRDLATSTSPGRIRNDFFR